MSVAPAEAVAGPVPPQHRPEVVVNAAPLEGQDDS